MTGSVSIMRSSGLAEYVAREVLSRAPTLARPPVDIEYLAGKLGVDHISRRRMVEDGRLDHGPFRVEISVKDGTSPVRQRFTIGHELGHVLLTEPDKMTVAYRALSTVDDVERFCDDFAAAVLMPQDWVMTRYASWPRSLSTLRSVAHHAQTSLSAAVVRLNRVLGWHEALVTWRRHDDIWRYQYAAGLPFRLHRDVRTTDATRGQLDEIGGRTHRDTWALLTLGVHGREVQVDAQVSARGNTAIALLRLPSEIDG